MKISVCIPMYNESSICRSAADTLFRAMEAHRSEYDYEVIFCDDGSDDGSAELLRGHIEKCGYSRFRVVGYENNRGKGAALKTGYALIEKQFPDCLGVVTADADGQHTVQDVWRWRHPSATALYTRTAILPTVRM